jgi:hypothetical protein
LASLSRTPAHEASLLSTNLTPYFLSKPSTDAITTDAQSVNGMKPILISVFSGLSDPAAHAPPPVSPSRPPAAASEAPWMMFLRVPSTFVPVDGLPCA